MAEVYWQALGSSDGGREELSLPVYTENEIPSPHWIPLQPAAHSER